LNACELQPSVADPVAETPIEQPDGMPDWIGLDLGTPQLVGSHFEVPVTVKGTLDPDNSPEFTAKTGALTNPTPTPHSIEAMILSHNHLFDESTEPPGTYTFKGAIYGDGAGVEVFSIVVITKAEIATLKTYLFKKMKTDDPLFIFEENPAAFGTDKAYPGYTDGWKKVGPLDGDAPTPGDPNIQVIGLTAGNFDEVISSLSVVVVVGKKVKVSFFDKEPFATAGKTAGASDFIIASSQTLADNRGAALEPVFVYEIDGSALTATP
jgi:hypothetical protein